MKRLRFAFITTVQYSQPVHGHQLALRCVPLNDAGQLLETYTVKIMPGRLPAPQKDGFGNTVFWCSIGSEHDVLRYGSRGIACVEEPGQPAPPPNSCLRFAGLRTKPGRILMQVSSSMARGKTLAALDALCHAVYSLLRYQPGATGIYTTAEEALAGGRGVCQDYAHVFIALARLAGWHARYCMGRNPCLGRNLLRRRMAWLRPDARLPYGRKLPAFCHRARCCGLPGGAGNLLRPCGPDADRFYARKRNLRQYAAAF